MCVCVLSHVQIFVTPWTGTRLLCPRYSPGKNTGVGSDSLLQETFLTQGWYLGLLHCRQILYQLSHQGSPSNVRGEIKSYRKTFLKMQNKYSATKKNAFHKLTSIDTNKGRISEYEETRIILHISFLYNIPKILL